MARLSRRAPENVPGDLFVDDSCIACDTCRRLSPGVYGGGEEDRAHVARQPAGPGERARALLALVACPVAAIGSLSKAGVAAAAASFPVPVEGAPDVLACGYAAESSFGAASWLVRRPGGNVLVDSPRFARPLLARLKALGGVRFLFLTHRDDVADHDRWADALGCERILHARDLSAGTAGVERRLEGEAPVALAPDLLAIPVPGHTPGSTALLFRGAVLFSGDHLWGDAEGRLGAARSVCWWSWDSQLRSLERLLAHDFALVLPGHGRPRRAGSAAEMRAELRRLLSALGRAEPATAPAS